MTGSTVKYSAICRTSVNEKIEVEIDHLYCTGQINKTVASNVLIPIIEHSGFFRVTPSAFEGIFFFLKKKETLVSLCPEATNKYNDANDFIDLFNEQNEFLHTETLREIFVKIPVHGTENATNVIISGPSSGTHLAINESFLARAISTLVPNIKPKTYNPVFLHDVIISAKNDLINLSEDLALSDTMSPFQRKCYLVGKTIYCAVTKRIDLYIFASYFFKTIMFKLLERQPSSYRENTSLIK